MRTTLEIVNQIEAEMEDRDRHMLAVRVAAVVRDEVTQDFWRRLNVYRESMIAEYARAVKARDDAKGSYPGRGFGVWEDEDERREFAKHDQKMQDLHDRVLGIEARYNDVVGLFGEDTVIAAWTWKEQEDANLHERD